MKATISDSLITIIVAYLNKFARDIYLPILPVLMGIFDTDQTTIQLTMTVFFFALFFGRLFWPILLERFDLRTIVHVNFSLFVFVTIVSLLVVDLFAFNVVRFIQGFTLGALPTIFRGYVFHRIQAKNTIKVLSFTGFVTVWAPGVAVAFGGALQMYFGWQAVTVGLLMSVILSWLYIALTLDKTIQKNTHLPFFKIFYHVIQLCLQRDFLSFSLPLSFLTAAVAGYLTMAPFLFIDQLGVSTEHFAWISMIIFSGMLVGKVLAGLLIDRWSIKRIMILGLLFACSSTIAIFMTYDSVMVAVAVLFLYLIGYGLLLPVSKTQVMNNCNGYVYSSTALIGVMAGLFSALASAFVAFVGWVDFSQLMLCLSSLAFLGLFSFMLTYK